MIRVIKQYGISILLLILAIFCLFNIGQNIQDAFTVVTNSLALLLAVVYFVNFERDIIIKIKSFVLNIKWPFHGQTKRILTNVLNFIIEKRWDIISYLFIFLLLVITLGQFSFLEKFINLSWINKYQVILTVLAILSGGLTFWHNRERVEKEIDKEQTDEQMVEDKRKTEFASKFPRINNVPVLRNLVKWMYKEGLKYAILLIVMMILGFMLRLWLGLHTNPDLDEGQLIYDAKLTSEGLIPFGDFTTRAPLLVYLLLIINKILGGFYILSSKILIALLFSINSLGVYLLSKEIFKSKKTAITSVILFNLAPLYLFYSIALHVAQASITFLVFFCLYFIRFIKKKYRINLLWAGLFLGLGYLVRRDLIIYTAFATFFLIYLNILKHEPIKDIIKNIFIFGVGFFLGVSPLLYLIYKTNILWIDKYYGLSSLIGQSLGQNISTININKWPILYNFILCNSIFILSYIYSFFSAVFKNRWFKVLYIIFISILFYLCLNVDPNFKIGGFNIYSSSIYNIVIVLSILYSLFIIFIFKKTKNANKAVLNFIYFIPAFYYLILFTTMKEFNLSYFIIVLFVPIIVFSNDIIKNINKISHKKHLYFILVLLLTFMLLLNINIFKSYNYERSWPNKDIESVNSFLKSINDDDEVFTIGFTLVIDSQKNITFPITHHRIYDITKCYQDQKFKALKCLDDLGSLFQNRSIKYIIGDQRTMLLIKDYENLRLPFEENYIPIKKVSKAITIFILKDSQ